MPRAASVELKRVVKGPRATNHQALAADFIRILCQLLSESSSSGAMGGSSALGDVVIPGLAARDAGGRLRSPTHHSWAANEEVS